MEQNLRSWYKAKKEIERLNKEIDNYKSEVSKEMHRTGKEFITEGNYSVTRTRNSRTYVSKDTLPKELWKEYSTTCNYDVYKLVKK